MSDRKFQIQEDVLVMHEGKQYEGTILDYSPIKRRYMVEIFYEGTIIVILAKKEDIQGFGSSQYYLADTA